MRGTGSSGRGDWALALADFEKTLQLDQKHAFALASTAQIRAASPDPKVRIGDKAAELANRACELTYWRDSFALESYAMAMAEKGDFAQAVKWQKKVLDDPEYLKWKGMEPRARLALYEAKEPYRMPSVEQKCDEW